MCLVVIALFSLFFKTYTIDFSLPLHFDDFVYVLDAIQYEQGDFFMPPKKNPGWPLFISPFVSLVNSNNFIDYSNLVRTLNLGISTFAILPMYFLSRKFFNEKFAIISTILFAFEPHLNYLSGQGLSEPIFILSFIVAFYFILNKNTKLAYLAFIAGGICWWIRLEGFYVFFILSIIFFINYRKSTNSLRNYLICVSIFLLVVSPMFVQRNAQYGDPFYVWYETTLFADDYGTLLTSPSNSSALDYVQKNDPISFLDRFIVNGFANLIITLGKISYPYLFIILPFGILFSLRPVDQNKDYVKSNWVVILITSAVLVIPFSTIEERRFLFPLFPFLILFATIPIQRITEYGLSTFTFSEQNKNYFLLIIIALVILLGGIFTIGIWGVGYGKPDVFLEQEKIAFTKSMINKLDGRILGGNDATEYIKYVQISDNDKFKNYKSPRGKDPYPDTYVPGSLSQINVYGDSIESLIKNGEKKGLKYIAISENGSYFFSFFTDIFNSESEYPYLKKIMDSEAMDYQKIKIKVYEINYKKFHEINDFS